FSEKASGAGIQPIIGCQLSVDFADEEPDRRRPGLPPPLPSLVLIAQSAEGYQSLARLVSRAYLDSPPGHAAHLPLEAFAGSAEGLIALTGAGGGALDRLLLAGQADQAERRLDRLLRLFGDRLYVEIQRHGTADEI